MRPSLVFRLVVLILTATFYQILFRMPNRRRLTSDEIPVGIDILQTCSCQRNVAEHMDVSQSVVSRMWTRYQTNENARHGGRGKATSDFQDCY